VNCFNLESHYQGQTSVCVGSPGLHRGQKDLGTLLYPTSHLSLAEELIGYGNLYLGLAYIFLDTIISAFALAEL
jgi:hypothetical protein